MVWSFLWRAVLYGVTFPYAATWVLGLAMGLAGSGHEAVLNAGRIAQLVAILFAVFVAWAQATAKKPA